MQDGHIGIAVLPFTCKVNSTNAIQTKDLPIMVRFEYANNASAVKLDSQMPSHVDIPRLRQGQVGGFFWSAFQAHFFDYAFEIIYRRSVYMDCPNEEAAGPDFVGATWVVRYVFC